MKTSETVKQTFASSTTQLTTASAQITFDFDTGLPPAVLRQATPFDQRSGGVTASFSSPEYPSGFSIQNHNTTLFNLSQFSGNYLQPSSTARYPLQIKFDQLAYRIELTFATVDYHDPGAGGEPTSIKLTAYLDSIANTPVSTATAHGILSGDSFPQGKISIDSGKQPFNLVTIEIIFLPQGATNFLIDNVTITTSPSR